MGDGLPTLVWITKVLERCWQQSFRLHKGGNSSALSRSTKQPQTGHTGRTAEKPSHPQPAPGKHLGGHFSPCLG